MEPGDMLKGLASSIAGKIAKRLGSISGGRVLDVTTAQGGSIDALMKTLREHDSFVGIAVRGGSVVARTFLFDSFCPSILSPGRSLHD